MADIFISYSQRDRTIAGDLARFLTSCGYDVWWDYDLVGGIKFRDQIKAQLGAARAAIVIWTPHSVESEWVIDEAEDAKTAKKLLPTRSPDLDFKSIPLGFRQLQTDPVDKPDLILRSLEGLNIKPSNAPEQQAAGPVIIGGQSVDKETLAKAEQFANWEYIKDSQHPAAFRDYMAKFPKSPLCELASARLATLANAAWKSLNLEESLRRSAPAEDVKRLDDFLATFPNSEFDDLARSKLYSLENQSYALLGMDDADALTRHLSLFPQGSAASEIRARLIDMRQRDSDRDAWERLKLAPSRAGIEAYLKQFPLGLHASEARVLLEPVVTAEKRVAKWAMIREQGYSEQLRAFIAEFQTGPEVDDARARLAKRLKDKEDDAWAAALHQARHPAVALLKLMKEFPEGARRGEALSTLHALPMALDAEAWAIVEGSNDADLYRGYLAALPFGAHVAEASAKIGKASKAEAVTKVPSKPRKPAELIKAAPQTPSDSIALPTEKPAPAASSQTTRKRSFSRVWQIFFVLAATGFGGAVVAEKFGFLYLSDFDIVIFTALYALLIMSAALRGMRNVIKHAKSAADDSRFISFHFQRIAWVAAGLAIFGVPALAHNDSSAVVLASVALTALILSRYYFPTRKLVAFGFSILSSIPAIAFAAIGLDKWPYQPLLGCSGVAIAVMCLLPLILYWRMPRATA